MARPVNLKNDSQAHHVPDEDPLLWIKLWIVDCLVDNSGDDVNNFLFMEVNAKSLLDLVETREKLVHCKATF